MWRLVLVMFFLSPHFSKMGTAKEHPCAVTFWVKMSHKIHKLEYWNTNRWWRKLLQMVVIKHYIHTLLYIAKWQLSYPIVGHSAEHKHALHLVSQNNYHLFIYFHFKLSFKQLYADYSYNWASEMTDWVESIMSN